MIATVGEIAIGFDDVGSGLPVAFIHGFPHNRSLWAPQMGSLAVDSRTLACDLRGFGESTGEATSVDDYADDVAGWLRGLGLSSVVVAGLSMGGYVAFALWRRHPSLMRALVLADTKAGPDDEKLKAKRTEHIELATERGSPVLADQLIQGMVGKTTRKRHPEIVERVHSMLSQAPVQAAVGALTALRDRPDSTPTLATIDIPTLIVVGDEDALTPVRESRAMHAAIPGSRLEIVTGAGHLPNVERPAAFNHLLSEFLGSIAYT